MRGRIIAGPPFAGRLDRFAANVGNGVAAIVVALIVVAVVLIRGGESGVRGFPSRAHNAAAPPAAPQNGMRSLSPRRRTALAIGPIGPSSWARLTTTGVPSSNSAITRPWSTFSVK